MELTVKKEFIRQELMILQTKVIEVYREYGHKRMANAILHFVTLAKSLIKDKEHEQR